MPFFRKSRRRGLMKMMGLSSGLHLVTVLFLSIVPMPEIMKAQPVVYSVSLMPVSPSPEPAPVRLPPPPPPKEEIRKPVEKAAPPEKPVVKPKKDDIVEKVKKTKVEKPPEKKPEEKPKEEKKTSPNLQEALEEIRKKAALDEIQKKVARRDKMEKVEEKPRPAESKYPVAAAVKNPPRSESKLNEYYSLIWAKIKESWTIPENLLKETIDLETIIVIIIEKDGKVRRMWFEKKSSNPLYDQMAMRAIMKAEPLPPIPREISETALEIGIRFLPE